MSSTNKHICLVIPPSPFLLDERVFMHIGILRVAASLEEKGFNIDLLDLAGVENYRDVISTFLEQNPEASTFGFTATTPQIPYAIKMAKMIRKIRPEAKLILGGTHVSLMNSATKKEDPKRSVRATTDMAKLEHEFDVVVAGDGEIAILRALEMDKGIVDADDPKSSLFLTNENLSQLPLPARHLVDVESYKYDIDGHNAVSLICQLGCPFRCTFCGGRNSPFLRRVRTRASDSVVEEIRHLHETYGFTGFMFYDDELNVNKEWETLLQKIIETQEHYGVEFSLRGFVKAELFTEKQATLMKEAGFSWLLTGFESGDPRILTNIDKIASVDDNTRCVELAKAAGLKVKALMSIGHAGESEETVYNTKKWLLKVKPEEFDCTIITTYPGTPYFDEAKKDGDRYMYVSPKTGDRLYQKDLNYFEDPDYYKGDPDGGYISYVWTDHLSPEQLVTLRESLEREVRSKLNLPFNRSGKSIKFEHSMGQGGISDTLLRRNY